MLQLLELTGVNDLAHVNLPVSILELNVMLIILASGGGSTT